MISNKKQPPRATRTQKDLQHQVHHGAHSLPKPLRAGAAQPLSSPHRSFCCKCAPRFCLAWDTVILCLSLAHLALALTPLSPPLRCS